MTPRFGVCVILDVFNFHYFVEKAGESIQHGRGTYPVVRVSDRSPRLGRPGRGGGNGQKCCSQSQPVQAGSRPYPITSFFKSRRLHSPPHTPPRIGLGGVLRRPNVAAFPRSLSSIHALPPITAPSVK